MSVNVPVAANVLMNTWSSMSKSEVETHTYPLLTTIEVCWSVQVYSLSTTCDHNN
jgi:hypothetical protein